MEERDILNSCVPDWVDEKKKINEVLLQFLWFAIGNGGIEQRQMYRQVGIFVYDVHKHITNS